MPARVLEIDRIAATVERLAERVGDRFAGRGIAELAAELVVIGRETEATVARLQQPRWGLRVLAGAVAVLAVVVLGLSVSTFGGFTVEGADEWLTFLQAVIQDIVFLGIAAVFLRGIEGKVKRREALTGLHGLRSFAHVIDMHQLTKDPDSALHPDASAAHSPERGLSRVELGRYLDYCSEMLSIVNKLAALYAQVSQDGEVLAAVRGVQDLTGGLTATIWQKIMILDTVEARAR